MGNTGAQRARPLKKHLDNVAFIIGNGPSREGFDLTMLPKTTWGCNAIYRDFAPDNLVACDKAMQEEIIATGYHEDHSCFFRYNHNRPRNFPDHPNIKTWTVKHCQPNNSGVSALYWALKSKPKTIVLLGLDLRATKHSANIYADSENYINQNNKPPKIRRTIPEKLNYWITANPRINWVRVVKEDVSWIPGNENVYEANRKPLEGFKSTPHISYEELIKWVK